MRASVKVNYMSSLEEKAAELQKFVKMFQEKPEAALLKPTVKATTKDGLVILKSVNTTWEEDLIPALGGKNTTIGPIQHLLGSLAGCAAALLKNTLSPLTGTAVDSVEVETHCDFDIKGVLGFPGATGDLRNISVNITIYSNESQDKIDKLVEVWKQRAPCYLALNPGQISSTVTVKKPGT
jgi:uncharacterized OsmC-like protein